MSVKLGLRDLIVTNQGNGKSKVEVCIFVGSTGFLMLTLKDNGAILRSHMERYVKEHESLPYSCSIVRYGSDEYETILGGR